MARTLHRPDPSLDPPTHGGAVPLALCAGCDSRQAWIPWARMLIPHPNPNGDGAACSGSGQQPQAAY